MLIKLLSLSHDFLVVTDPAGTCLDVGYHFQKALTLQGLTPQTLENLLRHALPLLCQGQSVHLPLAQYGMRASPFSLLHQDGDRIILIAEDQTPRLALQTLKKEIPQAAVRQVEKEKHADILLDESSDPIFSFAEDGTYLYVNTVFAHTLGHEKEHIIGKKIWDIFPRDEADKRFALVQKVFQTGRTDTIEVRVALPEGGDKFFLTTVKPVKDQTERVSFVICISKDITELRTTQSQLRTLHGLLPICSACKNIRNDKGAWQQIEDYISLHSNAVFTHGICPDCARKLYPGIFL